MKTFTFLVLILLSLPGHTLRKIEEVFISKQKITGENQCPFRVLYKKDGSMYKLPFCTNIDVITDHKKFSITDIYVVIHGLGAKPQINFRNILDGLKKSSKQFNALVIVPHFILDEHLADYPDHKELFYWRQLAHWSPGHKSSTLVKFPREFRISSYELLDHLLDKILEKVETKNLQRIAIIGHSAGGQFVNRYAAGSQIFQNHSVLKNIKSEFFIANPSSYLYFSHKRPQQDGSFKVPSRDQRLKCPKYNTYRQGMEKLNSYMRKSGSKKIPTRYLNHTVYYFLGDKDNDKNHRHLSKTCASMLQGEERYSRGKNYYRYLGDHFGPHVYHKHHLAILKGVGHSNKYVLQHPCALKYIYNDRKVRGCQTLKKLGPLN